MIFSTVTERSVLLLGMIEGIVTATEGREAPGSPSVAAVELARVEQAIELAFAAVFQTLRNGEQSAMRRNFHKVGMSVDDLLARVAAGGGV